MWLWSGVLRAELGLQRLPKTLPEPSCHLWAQTEKLTGGQHAHLPQVPSAKCTHTHDVFPVPCSRETNNLTHAHRCRKGFPGTGILKEKKDHWKVTAESSQSKIILQVYAGPSLRTTLQLIKRNHGALEPYFQEPEYGTHFEFGQTPSRRLFFYESSIQKLYSIPGRYSLTGTHGAMGPWH